MALPFRSDLPIQLAFLLLLPFFLPDAAAQRIDRESLVRRHDPHLTAVDVLSPLTVGNGNFACSVDITGMQTFEDDYYREGIKPETLANWAWHSFPNPDGWTLADASRTYQFQGRPVAYPTNDNNPAGRWLRANPHRFPLGQIGMTLLRADGTPASIRDLAAIDQRLDMWTGRIESRFTLDGVPVRVVTVAHPERDLVAFRIESPLLAEGRLRPNIRFPYAHTPDIKNNPPLNWDQPDGHRTVVLESGDGSLRLQRIADDLIYAVDLAWSDGELKRAGTHHFEVQGRGETLELLVEFRPVEPGQDAAAHPAPPPSVAEVECASAEGWRAFWTVGGAIDLSESADPRAAELERRIVTSMYLTAVQCAGDLPPQETGLTLNTWHGKHHTEMAWWHLAHFFQWGRGGLAERAMAWYRDVLPVAQATARHRGLTGAAWSKMVGIDGRESPGGNPFIIWNQPHIIYLAELAWRADPSDETLSRYSELVLETAEYLAGYAHWDEARDRYVLGPPLWLAQEIYDQATSQNPTCELAYWRWALEVGQAWRERLGMERDARWQHVIENLAPLPVVDGRYVGQESHPDTWSNPDSRQDHPSMLMALGFLPEGPMVDRAIMKNTLDAVMASWNWDVKIWGWDYPMIAMTAARLGEPELAVDVLLMDAPHNRYAASGHVYQRPDLPLYLPANGALLSAVALMACGWDGAERDAPGFPMEGWVVKYEGLEPLP